MKIKSSTQTRLRQTYRRRLAFLEILSEPKMLACSPILAFIPRAVLPESAQHTYLINIEFLLINSLIINRPHTSTGPLPDSLAHPGFCWPESKTFKSSVEVIAFINLCCTILSVPSMLAASILGPSLSQSVQNMRPVNQNNENVKNWSSKLKLTFSHLRQGELQCPEEIQGLPLAAQCACLGPCWQPGSHKKVYCQK